MTAPGKRSQEAVAEQLHVAGEHDQAGALGEQPVAPSRRRAPRGPGSRRAGKARAGTPRSRARARALGRAVLEATATISASRRGRCRAAPAGSCRSPRRAPRWEVVRPRRRTIAPRSAARTRARCAQRHRAGEARTSVNGCRSRGLLLVTPQQRTEGPMLLAILITVIITLGLGAAFRHERQRRADRPQALQQPLQRRLRRPRRPPRLSPAAPRQLRGSSWGSGPASYARTRAGDHIDRPGPMRRAPQARVSGRAATSSASSPPSSEYLPPASSVPASG